MTPDSGEFSNESVILYVISYMTCGVCGGEYRLQDVDVIDEDETMWAMVARCPHCGEEGLILAFASPLDDEGLPDLHPGLGRWDAGLAPLTEADVDAWRAFLDGFNGDMEDLLADLSAADAE